MTIAWKVNFKGWDGDGCMHVPEETLKEMGADVGLLEKYVGSSRGVVRTQSSQIFGRTDE